MYPLPFKLGMAGRVMHGAYARFDDLDLDAKSQWVGKGKKKKSVELFRQASKQ